ncbi:MAG: GH92 family glycosyl hydrolase [Burkholderiaceae bacterium]
MNRREFGRLVARAAAGPIALGFPFELRSAVEDASDVLRWVDPFIGTDGTGHVTPAAAFPFGMVMPGPDHADGGWSYASGYQWTATHTLGFSNTHISGAGIPELGDVLLMPSVNLGWTEQTRDFSAPHDKASERASPGHYSVALPSHGVLVECTASQRMACHRWTLLRDGPVQVLLDLHHGLHFEAAQNQGMRVREIDLEIQQGESQVAGRLHLINWVDRECAFVVEFSRPIRRVRAVTPRSGSERAPRFILEFDGGVGSALEARVALSTVDIDGARANLRADSRRPFDEVHGESRRAWQSILGRLQIQADDRTRRIFYSALYRSFLHPSNVADVTGQVRGPKGQVMQVPSGIYDSTLSLWDTFRCVHPLHALLMPERVQAQVESIVLHQEQMGFLPIWTVWGRESYCMIGNPAMPVISRAVEMGLVDEPLARRALAAMIASATQSRPQAPDWAQRDWLLFDQYGYLPFDLYTGGESVSKALEYGIGDEALARVARRLGETATAQRFQRRSENWKRLYDPSTQVMRGRDSRGQWRSPFDPLDATSPMNNPGDYTEANAWQYTPTPALHDPIGFREVLGGASALEAWLDAFFSTPMKRADKHLGQEAMIGLHAHGNEPGHHVPWLYGLTDRPEKGVRLVHQIAQSFYSDRPNGIMGNDDCGQMGAWYVWAALGQYPLHPGSAQLFRGVPLVEAAVVRPSAA